MTETNILQGKAIKEKILEKVKAECTELVKQYGPNPPKLVALKIGDDAEGDLYLKSQRKNCEAVGARHEIRALPQGASLEDVKKTLAELNEDGTVDGIFVQMPLPKHLDPDEVLDGLNWRKDVEGVHPYNLGILVLARPAVLPCTPAACVELINAAKVDLYGKEVVVVGASVQVGKPISILLFDRMATVTMCRSSASKKGTLEQHVRRADVLVVAIGQPKTVRGEWIKEGAVVIDAGITFVDGKTVGDVEFEKAKKHASAITPVPGGVGPVTSAMLMQNLIGAARCRRSL